MPKIKTGDSVFVIVRRAFSEFLLLPSIVIILFLALAGLTSFLDQERITTLKPVRQFLQQHIFADPEATSNLLGAIVSGTISVTTLTTTLLLVIVQQSAGSMTAQVFDQFLRRKTNQFYLGFFVGLALYSMIILATVNKPFNPVWGGTTAFCLTALALYFLVLLMYTTINQMRPAEIVNAIYYRIVAARERQLKTFSFTTSDVEFINESKSVILCEKGGYVTDIDTKLLAEFMKSNFPLSKVAFTICLGDYVAYGEELAQIINGENHENQIKKAVLNHIRFDIQRDLDNDAGYGISQIETIAWTSISTAHSNPAPGVLCVNLMHNILGVLADEGSLHKDQDCNFIVYTDNVFEELMSGFENLLVVSSESMQHQVFISVLHTLINMLRKLSPELQNRSEAVILLALSVMGDHAYTKSLQEILLKVSKELSLIGLTETAVKVENARKQLESSLGVLNSRSTRVR
ncbi:DUF2254 domain-containing protein [Mucilaginibacter achroorhodeus]|uniref:DUF2254 domain-containing protein n=1 Tax=Mucilaginibacter achroorhodeus TaxID=2599294 RepID=A0A563U5X1_9SPHI|nr:DUF2254 family protein [Mucilaginibacter achroorhodeus]TWR26723.1 DUF2254 domain-containing protein [Mucilaginibacter achroorhodeus]